MSIFVEHTLGSFGVWDDGLTCSRRERLTSICGQWLNFLEKPNVLYKPQYGFRKKRSTIQPITKLLLVITNKNDKPSKHLTTAIFLDLNKAFDTLNHDKLLKKLQYCGIRGHSNDWFRNYLYNRKHYVTYNGSSSQLIDIQMDVPHGRLKTWPDTILNLHQWYKKCNLNLLSYADDTTVYKSGKSLPDEIPQINNELEKLNQWFKSNKLALNLTRTNYMVFTPSNKYVHSNLNIMADSKEISWLQLITLNLSPPLHALSMWAQV